MTSTEQPDVHIYYYLLPPKMNDPAARAASKCSKNCKPQISPTTPALNAPTKGITYMIGYDVVVN